MNIYHKTGILETYSIGRWVEEQQKHSFQKNFMGYYYEAPSSLSYTKFDLMFGASVHQNPPMWNNTGVKCSDISVQLRYFIGDQVSMVTVLSQINRGWIEQRAVCGDVTDVAPNKMSPNWKQTHS